MQVGWFGIPWYVYGAGCLLVALGYGFFVIDPARGYNWANQPLWRLLILRWFHSLVWVLLGLACLVMQLTGGQATTWAKGLGVAGLLVYMLYMPFFFLEKGKSPS